MFPKGYDLWDPFLLGDKWVQTMSERCPPLHIKATEYCDFQG